MPAGLIPVIIAVLAVIAVVVMFKLMWRVAEPNEAMIISGRRRSDAPKGAGESATFRIVTGKGTLVIPGIETVRSLKLDLRKADLNVSCVTSQGIPVIVNGVALFKVADDFASIANATRRFLGKQETLEDRVHNVFAGHLRSIIGGLTVEQLIRDREALTTKTRDSVAQEMTKLGFLLESLTIQEIDDPSGYIKNLSKPHIAEVQKLARIAEATNNREASQQEAGSAAQIAESQRDADIKRASYDADVEEAQARAQQAGPLAEAQSRQDVVRQETEVATLEAERTERQLDAQVRKPADAQNYAQVKRAEADRQAAILQAEAEAERTKLSAVANADQTTRIGQADASAIAARGQAEGTALEAKGVAEGKALKARAEGLAANQDAVISQQITNQLPDIIAAAAKPFEHIDNMTVLNGASGLMDALNSVISQGMTSFNVVREAMQHNTNGTKHEDWTGDDRMPKPEAPRTVLVTTHDETEE